MDLTYLQQTGDPGGDAGDELTGLDRYGQVVDQRWLKTSNGTATDRFQYGHDRDGNVMYENNLLYPALSELYGRNSADPGDDNDAYDLFNRLILFQRGTLSVSGNNGDHPDTIASPDQTIDYDLDALGNRTEDGQTYNGQNELAAADGHTLGYDNQGDTTADNEGHALVYDAWGRLVTVKTSAAGSAIASYTYDGAGRRITETHGGTTRDLYHSPAGQVLEERQGSAVKDQYVWSAAYVNAMVLRDADADDNSSTGSLGTTGSGLELRLYVQTDANYNVTALIDTSGAVVERYIYDPYGTVTVYNPNWSAKSGNTRGFGWNNLHQGGRIDDSTGLYAFGARDYDAGLGRWMEQDPTGYPDGLNAYAFDPMGLDPTGCDRIPSTRPTTVLSPAAQNAPPTPMEFNGLYVSVPVATLLTGQSAPVGLELARWSTELDLKLIDSTSAISAEGNYVNLVSGDRTIHILYGDGPTSGGHMWPGITPNKTPFPENWSAPKIMDAVSDIASDPTLQWIREDSKTSLYYKSGAPAQGWITGIRDAVAIKVLSEPMGEGVITAYPNTLMTMRLGINSGIEASIQLDTTANAAYAAASQFPIIANMASNTEQASAAATASQLSKANWILIGLTAAERYTLGAAADAHEQHIPYTQAVKQKASGDASAIWNFITEIPAAIDSLFFSRNLYGSGGGT